MRITIKAGVAETKSQDPKDQLEELQDKPENEDSAL